MKSFTSCSALIYSCALLDALLSLAATESDHRKPKEELYARYFPSRLAQFWLGFIRFFARGAFRLGSHGQIDCGLSQHCGGFVRSRAARAFAFRLWLEVYLWSRLRSSPGSWIWLRARG